MVQINGRTRPEFKNMLWERDGGFCQRCFRIPPDITLVIDHKDNNSLNNDFDNLQLLCRRCNFLKNPRNTSRHVSVSSDPSDPPEPILINRNKEPQFRKYLAQRINEAERVPQNDIINSGAEILGVSPVTIRRYLDKRVSSEGAYTLKRIGGTVVVCYKDEFQLT